MSYLTERLLNAQYHNHEEDCCCGEECCCHDHEEKEIEQQLSEEEIEKIIEEKYSEKDEKTKHFIRRMLYKFGDYYTYEKSTFVSYTERIIITCPVHGDVERTPGRFFNPIVKIACPRCALENSKETRKSTTDNFIKKAKSIHGDKFDYTKSVYKGNRSPIIVTCPIHGDFETTPHGHYYSKVGACPECAKANSTGPSHKYRPKMTTELFIEEARKVHGDKYSYGESDFVNYKTPVKIYCPDHGYFNQTPNSHLSGCGCPECAKIRTINALTSTTEDFLVKAREVHGDKYIYDKVEYERNNKPVEIICREHGSFFQTPEHHLRGNGCPTCGNNQLKSLEEFIREAELVHGPGTYVYDSVEYKGSEVPIKVYDPLFGDYFWTKPHLFLKGFGNSARGMTSGERFVYTWLKNNGIDFKREFSIPAKDFMGVDFGVRIDFIIEDYNDRKIFIEYNGEQHYSIRSQLYANNKEDFIAQLKRDNYLRDYCKIHNIYLIEIPYKYHTYGMVNKFLTKVLLEEIDPNTLVDYSSLYVMGDDST